MSFAKLDDLCRQLDSLSHALSMLGVDEAVMMPDGGGGKRAEAMASLSAMYHDMAAAPHVADWIADAENESLEEMQRIAVKEFKRSYINRTCLTSVFVKRQTEQRMRCEQLWRQLRPKGDWKGFLPSLSAVIDTMREEAAMRAAVLKLDPYDALIEQYDPGSRAAEITPVFTELKIFLKGFIPVALEKQKQRLSKNKPKKLKGPFPIAAQKAMGEQVMKALGFDFAHGRLDVSHHPFCGGVPSDVRMTTRYRTDEFLSALMGIMHETGHGLYEQNLPQAWQHWPSGSARGMAMHESQSLFVEKQIGRNPAFWSYGVPLLKKHLGTATFRAWKKQDYLNHVLEVKPGLIRVDADEATYPMHVILRYELEQDLVSGRMKTADIPEAWNEKMTQYLNLSTKDNMRDGPMQDVHWPSGAFGYFPSYTLGALMAAQQWAAIKRKHPDVNKEVAKGDFSTLHVWRKKNIWDKASTASTPELMKRATGEAVHAGHFIHHLQQRYG
jgi:carboxypeptidase Taq